MSESFYGRPPVQDARNLRRHIFDIESNVRQFRITYREAAFNEKGDKGLYEKANDERKVIVDDVTNLKSLVKDFSPADQEIIQKALARIEDVLQMHPIFPPPLLRGSSSDLNARETSSDTMDNRKKSKNRKKRSTAVSENLNASISHSPSSGRYDVLRPNDDDTSTLIESEDDTPSKDANLEMLFHKSVSEVGDPPDPTTLGATGTVPVASHVSKTQSEGELNAMAALQRDNLNVQTDDFLARIMKTIDLMKENVLSGKNLNESEADMYSAIQGGYKTAREWSGSLVGTKRDARDSFAFKATKKRNESQNQAKRNLTLDSPHPRHINLSEFIQTGARQKTKDTQQASQKMPPPLYKNPPPPAQNAGFFGAPPPPFRPPTVNVNPPTPNSIRPQPFPAQPTLPSVFPHAYNPIVTKTKSMNPTTPTFVPTPTIVPTVVPTYVPTPTVATANPPTAPIHTVSSQPLQSDINERMLNISIERECKAALVNLRPHHSKKFDAVRDIDFDAHYNSFIRAMKVDGITDTIKLQELRFWFDGEPLKLMDLFFFEEDTSIQFSNATKELVKRYGKKINSAELILEKLLEGPEVKEDNYKGINTLWLELRKLELNLSMVNKTSLLNSTDTINRIIRTRVPWAAKRWCKKRQSINNNWNGEPDKLQDLSLNDLLTILDAQVEFGSYVDATLGKKENKPPVATDNKERGKKQKKTEESNVATTISAIDTAPENAPAANFSPINAATNSNQQWGNTYRGGRGGGRGGRQNNGRGGRLSRGATNNYNGLQQQQQQWHQNSFNTRGNQSYYQGAMRGGRGRGRGRGYYNNSYYNNSAPALPTATAAETPSQSGESKTTAEPPWECKSCGGTSFHAILDCPSFQKADVDGRFDIMKIHGCCWICLEPEHRAIDCNKIELRCTMCGGPHNDMLHRPKQNA